MTESKYNESFHTSCNFPRLIDTQYEFRVGNDMYTVASGYASSEAAWGGIRVLVNGDVTEQSVQYWIGLVLWYMETEGAKYRPSYTISDLIRAGKACHVIKEVPTFTRLNKLIGYKSTFGQECDTWDIVYSRCEAYNTNKEVC
jgi:hypothetical protein